MSEAIRELREHYQARIRAAQQALITLVESCPHVGATVVPRGDTGNYDPSADRYWNDHHCPDCGRFWQTDQ